MVPKKRKAKLRRAVLRLSDLDHSKTAVLNALTSPASRRTYEYAIEQFIAWYCSEPRLALNRIVVVGTAYILKPMDWRHQRSIKGWLPSGDSRMKRRSADC